MIGRAPGLEGHALLYNNNIGDEAQAALKAAARAKGADSGRTHALCRNTCTYNAHACTEI